MKIAGSDHYVFWNSKCSNQGQIWTMNKQMSETFWIQHNVKHIIWGVFELLRERPIFISIISRK